MISGQAGYKARVVAGVMVVFALWATAAIAGVNEDFLNAAKRGDLPGVRSFLAKGANVNAKLTNGATALHMASWQGRKETVQVLIDKGAHVNAKDNDGATALHMASQNGRKETVQVLIDKRADINAKNNHGGTALMVASYQGHKEIVRLLLAKGADVNAKASDGSTALMLSTNAGVRTLLMQAGAITEKSVPAGANAGWIPLPPPPEAGTCEECAVWDGSKWVCMTESERKQLRPNSPASCEAIIPD